MLLSTSLVRMALRRHTPLKQARERFHPALPYRLSGMLVLLLVVASSSGLLIPGLYRDTAKWAAMTRGTDLVTLMLAVPALSVALILAAHGSLRARIVWLGVLTYILYTYIIFAFDIAFNPLFLVYVATLSLSLFSLMALLARMDPADLRACIAPSLPVRSIAGYLLVVAALFWLTWLKDIVPAIVGNTTPTSLEGMRLPTDPVHVLDLGVLLPLVALSAIWLRQRRPWGYLLAGVFLVKMTILGVSVIAGTLFEHGVDPTVSLAILPMFVVITLGGLSLMVLYLRNIRQGPEGGLP